MTRSATLSDDAPERHDAVGDLTARRCGIIRRKQVQQQSRELQDRLKRGCAPIGMCPDFEHRDVGVAAMFCELEAEPGLPSARRPAEPDDPRLTGARREKPVRQQGKFILAMLEIGEVRRLERLDGGIRAHVLEFEDFEGLRYPAHLPASDRCHHAEAAHELAAGIAHVDRAGFGQRLHTTRDVNRDAIGLPFVDAGGRGRFRYDQSRVKPDPDLDPAFGQMKAVPDRERCATGEQGVPFLDPGSSEKRHDAVAENVHHGPAELLHGLTHHGHRRSEPLHRLFGSRTETSSVEATISANRIVVGLNSPCVSVLRKESGAVRGASSRPHCGQNLAPGGHWC